MVTVFFSGKPNLYVYLEYDIVCFFDKHFLEQFFPENYTMSFWLFILHKGSRSNFLMFLWQSNSTLNCLVHQLKKRDFPDEDCIPVWRIISFFFSWPPGFPILSWPPQDFWKFSIFFNISWKLFRHIINNKKQNHNKNLLFKAKLFDT